MFAAHTARANMRARKAARLIAAHALYTRYLYTNYTLHSMRLFFVTVALLSARPAVARVCPPFAEADGDGGCVVCDCAGACFDAARLLAWPADGRCDDAAPDYACAAFEFDGGDCAAAPVDESAVVLRENVFSRDIVAVAVV